MPTTATRTWWTEPFRMFQTNLREVDTDLDVEAVVGAIEDQGANVWLVGAGGIVSHYPTELEFQRRSPHLARRPSGDLIGDALDAARERDIKLIARFDFSKIDSEIAERHPDWVFVDADGERQVYNGLVSTCPAAGYYQEASFEVLREFFERYPVDGLFFNWMMFPFLDYSYRWRGACFCDACVRGFSEFSGGRELPRERSGEAFEAWLAYTGSVLADLNGRYRELLAQYAPQAAFLSGPESAVAFHEANNAIGREFWPFDTSQAVSELRSRPGARPVVVNSVAFLDMVYRFAAEEPERFRQYAIQTISRGGNPSAYIMGSPGGTVDYESVAAVRDIFHFHRANSEHYAGARPAARIGIVRAHPEFVETISALFLGTTSASTRESEFRGWYRALTETHHAFDVVRLSEVSRLSEQTELSRYSVIILPDLGPLDDRTVAALDSFVSDGGTVIATGTTAISADGTVRLSALPAARVRSVVDDAEELRNSYAGPRQSTASDHGPYDGPLLPIIGSRAEVVWHDDADRRGELLSGAPFGPPEKCYGNVRTGEPAYAVAQGDGGAAYHVPWTIGASYSLSSMRVVRDLMRRIVGEAIGEADVRTDLPEQVEITLMHNDRGLLVHVNNYTGIDFNGFGAPLPLSGHRLLLPRSGGRSARALVAGAELATARSADGLIIELPVIGHFEAIQVTEA